MNFAEKPVLTGDLVTLRPVEVADAAGVLACDPETLRLTGSHGLDALTLEDAEKWYATRADHDDRIDLSVIERATGERAGEAVLNDLDARNRSCSFRIALRGPRFYGRGLGTEATRLIVDYAFGVAGVHRVGLEVFDFNPRARHVYEKIGFVHEGTMREALLWDGERVDCHVWGCWPGSGSGNRAAVRGAAAQPGGRRPASLPGQDVCLAALSTRG